MKILKTILFFTILFLHFVFLNNAFAQCKPYIKIDGQMVLADNSASGIRLPYWLVAGQTLEADLTMVNSISVIEFTVNSTTLSLDFSTVKKVTASETVASGKVWKIESISTKPQYSSNTDNKQTYDIPGTWSWVVPSCIDYICVEVWGAGGGAGRNSTVGGGGGAGAYAAKCFNVIPGQTCTITVGTGGTIQATALPGTDGGSSSVVYTPGSINVLAGGGYGGLSASPFTGGAGGTASGGSWNLPGEAGETGVAATYGGKGGSSPTGSPGYGGLRATTANSAGNSASKPAGGGGGAFGSTGTYSGGSGASGTVIILW